MNPTTSDAVAPLPPAGGQIVPAPQLPAQETDASWSQVKYWAATAAKCQPSTGQEKRGQNLHKCLIFLGFSAVFAGFRQIHAITITTIKARHGFANPDLLVIIAVLAILVTIGLPIIPKRRGY